MCGGGGCPSWGPIFLVAATQICGPAVCRSLQVLLKTSVEWSNGFIAGSCVYWLSSEGFVLFVSFCGDIYFGGFQVFWLTISTVGKASLEGHSGHWWPFPVLWVYDLPEWLSLLLDITAHVSPRLHPGGGRLKQTIGTFLCWACWYFFLHPFSPSFSVQCLLYMALSWLQVHSLRRITWHGAISGNIFLQIKF